MRSHPDRTHRHRITFKGAGTAYVDTATKRLFGVGAKWSVLIGLPSGVFCAMLVANNPWIGFVAGFAGGGLFGRIGGMIYAGLTNKDLHRERDAAPKQIDAMLRGNSKIPEVKR